MGVGERPHLRAELRDGAVEAVVVRLQVRGVGLDAADRVREGLPLSTGVRLDVEDRLTGLLHGVDQRNDAGLLECRLGGDHRLDG